MLNFEADEVRKHITHKINNACVDILPFQHLVIDDFFPKQFYRQLNRHFPDHVDVGFHDLMKWKFRFIKSIFCLETNNTKEEATNIYNTLSHVFTKDLAEIILKKFNIEVKSKIAWMCDYCWDFPNDDRQSLAPHTDHTSKIVSMIVYLPIMETPIRVIDGQIQYLPMPGTDLLVQQPDQSFTKVNEVKALSNRATMFCKSAISWHSVDPTLYPRKTITMFIIDPTDCKCKKGFFYKEL
jgi:hypothetical protein